MCCVQHRKRYYAQRACRASDVDSTIHALMSCLSGDMNRIIFVIQNAPHQRLNAN